jgi:uncharacterized repeat protein (TIGR01451 family)
MSRRVHLAFLLLTLLFCGAPTGAQPPAATLPPLLYVKLIGPKGMQVTCFRGAAPGQSFATPGTIGIRPGYSVRLAITIPDYPNTTFYPTLEARGSLMMANQFRQADYPAALVFRAEDFARIQANATLNKVVVLERPESAIPAATKPDEPLEIAVIGNRDPLHEAFERGQPLLLMQMGSRELTRAEIANVPGTLLLPGEKALAAPLVAPWVAWQCFPVIDPRAGPGDPNDFMHVPDGGDVGLPAGFNKQGKLAGLDPSDTVAEYFDSRGRQRLAVSNRVALCIPRFVVVTSAAAVANQIAATGPGATESVRAFAGTQSVQPTLEHSQRLQLEKIGTNLKASANQQLMGIAATGRIENLVVVGTVRGTGSIQSAVPGPTCEPEDGPLLIIKWPDRYGALVGELVTFTLKYTNSGGRPITNIAVSDSLTNRFEYVPGTAKTDREAIFTTQPNDAGSLSLRWEITGSLQPRESGLITFQVRVR